MINNSLITSFFTPPHNNVGTIQLSPDISPIQLSPGSLESLESLSIQEKPSPERRVCVLQRQLSDLDSSIDILSECSILGEDRSLLLLEDCTGELANKGETAQPQKQSTLSRIFPKPASPEPAVGCVVANKREKRKAAIRASQQMTDLLTSRSRDSNTATHMDDRNVVAPIFLSTAEKKRLREQSLEEERRAERKQKLEQEAERIKYRGFLKFATEPILNSKTTETATLTAEDKHTFLWTPLKHVRQLPTNSTEARGYISLPVAEPSCYPVLDTERINYEFLKVESAKRNSNLPHLGVLLTSEGQLTSRVSELTDLFPTLPVKELFSLYLSLTHPPDPTDAAALSNQSSGTESKKRTRQRDIDNPLSFKSKRRRNQASPPVSKSPDCIIVDCQSDSNPSSLLGETVLWTDKLLPAASSLLLSDATAVSRMREFLREWQRRDSNYPTENSTNSSADAKSKAELTDSSDDDFEVFIKRQRYLHEDTRDSIISSDQALSGTMLLTGGVSTGKTSSVYVIAQELGMKVLEINTCMNRSGRDLQLCLSEATQSFAVIASEKKSNNKVINTKSNCVSYASHFGKLNPKVLKNKILTKPPNDFPAGKSALTLTDDTIILLDEVDLLFEPERGFWPAFQQIARETKLPIFLTANESNDLEIIPDIFTNHTFFQPISVSKLSLLIHLLFLVRNINIPKSLATDIAIYFWPDHRQIIHLLQFWLSSSTHNSAPNGINNIRLFLSSFVMRTELFIFNIHSLTSSFISEVIPKSESETAKKYKRPLLRIQYRTTNVISSLEVYQSKLIPSSYRFPITTANLGDGFSPDTLTDFTSSFHQALCTELIATECDLITRLVQSQEYTSNFKEDYLEGLGSEARDVDKKRLWENSLISVSESILAERSVFSHRDYGEHYLPYLKSICVSEGDRQIHNRRRRHFKHYLSSCLSPEQINSLTDSELID